MDNNKDIEMATKLSTGTTDNIVSPKGSSDDRPPSPPKRDFKAEESATVENPDLKRKSTGLFPRPEIISKPEYTETWISMGCLKMLLIIFNLLIWLFGAALTGIGIWIKIDEDFWELETGLNLKGFSSATTILIVAGVIIMIIGFLGCYGAIAQTLWMLILYAVIVVIIILLEVAVMFIVWSAITNKDAKEHIKSKAKEAMQEMAQNDYQHHFVSLLQSKLKCCGVDGPDDYKDSYIPTSCTNPETGFPFEKGCLEVTIDFFKSKADVVGGVAVAVFLLQVAALVLTLCVACGIKNAATNVIC